MTSSVVNNVININYYTIDAPTWVYTIRLTQIFEGQMLNGRIVPLGLNMIPNLVPTIVTLPPTTTSMNFNITLTPKAPNIVPISNLVISNTYWLKTSGKNVCPDANARYCVKFTAGFQYIQATPNTNLVFVWELLNNQLLTPVVNPSATKPQVLNNLAFLSVEPSTVNFDNLNPNLAGVAQPVRVEVRVDNITTNGVWVIYNLGTALNVRLAHDPVFGVNNGVNLTIQIVTTALSIGIVIAFLVILGCSIYVYRGNTKAYYRQLRVIQDDE